MTNLTSIAQVTKKILPVFLFLFLIVLFIGLIFYKQKNSNVKPITSLPEIKPPSFNVDPTVKSPQSIQSMNFQKIDLPSEESVYSVVKREVSKQTAVAVAQIFEFNQDTLPTEENSFDGLSFNWKQGDRSLTLSQSTIRYEILNLQNMPVGNLTEADLLNKVISFLSRITLLNPGFYFNPNATGYYKLVASRRVNTNSFPNSDFVEFQFNQKLSDTLLVGQTPAAARIRIRITKKGDIIFLHSRFFQDFIEKDKYPLKNLETAIQEIKSGHGVLVEQTVFDKNNVPQHYSMEPAEIKEVILNKVELAYSLPQDLKELIQPIFVFEGSFNYNDLKGKAIIYLPAINF